MKFTSPSITRFPFSHDHKSTHGKRVSSLPKQASSSNRRYSCQALRPSARRGARKFEPTTRTRVKTLAGRHPRASARSKRRVSAVADKLEQASDRQWASRGAKMCGPGLACVHARTQTNERPRGCLEVHLCIELCPCPGVYLLSFCTAMSASSAWIPLNPRP